MGTRTRITLPPRAGNVVTKGFRSLGRIEVPAPARCPLLAPHGWEGEVPVRGNEDNLVALLPRGGQSFPCPQVASPSPAQDPCSVTLESGKVEGGSHGAPQRGLAVLGPLS